MIVLYIFICIAVELFGDVLQVWNDDKPYFYAICTLFTPTWFKNMTYMNKFGCYFCAFLCVIFMPVGTIYRILYWLCHL